MDLQNLRAQDGMTQIATNDHYKSRGENGKEQEKGNPVLITEVHMGVMLSSLPNLLLIFTFNPPRCRVRAKGNTLKKTCCQVENLYDPQDQSSLCPIHLMEMGS